MTVFNEYADYYNIFYAEKDYKKEAEYVSGLIKEYSKIKVEKILNIGCGTGNHDKYFSEMGYEIDGFDLSAKMIEGAKNQNIPDSNYFVENIKNFKSDKKYDAIISLFHVLSYQNSNEEVQSMFSIINKNLKPGGIYIFDCWYGPGVLNDPPVVRTKEFESATEKILRTAIPEMRFNENIVDVNYNLEIMDINTGLKRKLEETHSMRYFFIPELKLFAKTNNLEVFDFFEWMNLKNPTEKSWNICFIGKKKERELL